MTSAIAQVIEQADKLLPAVDPKPSEKSLSELRKSLRLSTKMREAIEYHADHGVTITATAEQYSVSTKGLSEALHKASVQEYLNVRNETRLALLRSKATRRVGELIDGARSEYVQLEAARTVLAETKKDERTAGAGDVSITIVL